MNETGALIIGFISYSYTLYLLADAASDFLDKKCSCLQLVCRLLTFLFVINKFWEVIK